MKRPTIILLACLALSAMAADSRLTAKARGGFEIADHSRSSGSPATVTFDITQDAGQTRGEFIFAAEDHRHYPHLIVKVLDVTSAKFSKNTLSFVQPGLMNDEPVTVELYARDSRTAAVADFVRLTVRNMQGAELYHVHGDFQVGDVAITGGGK